jgi:hypothetical protein
MQKNISILASKKMAENWFQQTITPNVVQKTVWVIANNNEVLKVSQKSAVNMAALTGCHAFKMTYRNGHIETELL